MVTLAPEAAARIARPWLQKANAPFTGSLPGASSQYPEVLTHVLSSSILTDPGPATLSVVAEAEQAFSRGEYAEAVRILGEAQELNPADTQARNLKEKALREQDRLRELREALSSGQRAMNQGDLTGAEQELHRALQLDQNNPQAAELLEQIRQDRLSRERDFRLKEALWQADNLVSAGNFEEAQNRLLELQQDFPSSDAIQLKLQILDPFVRSRKLVQDGEHAFNQGEYAEAVRALTEALVLNPQDTEARDLKDRALQERDRLRQVREALSSGQRAMRQGDASAAEREFQKALQLDPTNTQATSLLGQIRQAQAAREREVRFREALQQSDNLVAERRFDDAQRALLELQQEFPDSAEIDQKLLELDQQLKLGRLLAEGQHAFDQGEFGEAVRILTEAQELDPSNERVRDLKVRAVQERDRLRQVREAISAGQRAMRQGDAGVAEREYQRALQLDPANAQATTLLAQLQKDRQAREREQRLQEGLSQAEKLLAGKKFDEAQRKLMKLQQAYPDAEEVQQKLQALSQRKAEAAAPPPLPAPSAPAKVPRGGVPLSDAAKSMQYAEELRRSLQTPRPSEPAPPAKPPAPALTPTIPIGQAPVQATQMIEAPLAGMAPDAQGATLLLGSSLKEQARAEQMALEAPPPPPLPPVLPAVPPPAAQLPGAEPPPPVPAPKPKPVAPPPKPAVEVKRPAPKPPAQPPTPVAIWKKPAVLAAGAILIVAIVVVVLLRKPSPPVQPNLRPTAEELSAKDRATQFESQHKLKEALNEWEEVQAKHGALANDAADAIAQVQKEQASAQELFDQGKTLEGQGNPDSLNKAISSYQQAEQADQDLKEQAEARIADIQARIAGKTPEQIEQSAFRRGQSAFTARKYKQAIPDLQSVVEKNLSGSTLVPKAKDMLGRAEAALRDEEKFDDAVNKFKSNDMDQAEAIFKDLANRNDDYKADAQNYLKQISDQREAATNAEAKKRATEAATNQVKDAVNNHQYAQADSLLAQVQKLGGPTDDLRSSINRGYVSEFSQIKGEEASHQSDAPGLRVVEGKFKDLAQRAGSPRGDNARDEGKDLEGQAAKLEAKVVPPPPQPVTPQPVTPPPAPVAAPTPVVTLIPSGDFQRWNGPVSKGQMIPDNSIEGGLRPVGKLTIPPIPDAPAKAVVIFIVNIDPNGNVTPGRKTVDDFALGPQVMAAARAWKFNPPTVRGKAVSTTIQVRVTF